MSDRRVPSVDPAAVGYGVLTVVASGQVAADRASVDDVLVFGLPVALLLAAAWWSRGSRGGREPGERAVRGLAVAGAVLAAWAVVAFVGALPAANGPDGFYDVKVRVTTPVADHNVLASLLLVALVAAALVRGRLGWVLTAALTLGLGATLSRGAALVAVVLALAAWLLAASPRNSTLPPHGWGGTFDLRGSAVRVAAGAVGALALVLLAAGVLGAAVPAGDGPTSVASRGQLWRAGVAAVAEEPLLGVGLDGFRAVAAAEGAADPRDHAHSSPLHAAATVGVPAALVHLALWLLVVLRGWRHDDPRTATLLVLGGAALLLHGLVDETAFRLPVELTVAALLALGATAPLGGGARR